MMVPKSTIYKQKKSFYLFFYIMMSFLTSSDISQHDANILEEQHHKMQWQHEEEQWLLVCLEEVAEACHVKHAAQKARREVEAKIREKAKKQKLAEKEKKKKQLEYIQQLQNKMLVEDATLLESTKRS